MCVPQAIDFSEGCRVFDADFRQEPEMVGTDEEPFFDDALVDAATQPAGRRIRVIIGGLIRTTPATAGNPCPKYWPSRNTLPSPTPSA